MEKEHLKELIRDYLLKRTGAKDIPGIEHLIKTDPQAAEIYNSLLEKIKDNEAQTDDFTSGDKKKAYARLGKLIRNASLPPLPGQVWEIKGLNEKVVVLDGPRNSISGMDYRVMVISSKTDFAQMYDLVFSDDDFLNQEQVAHTHLAGNIHRRDFSRLYAELANTTFDCIKSADKKKKCELPANITRGKGVIPHLADEYENWLEFTRTKLQAFSLLLLKEAEAIQIKKTPVKIIKLITDNLPHTGPHIHDTALSFRYAAQSVSNYASLIPPESADLFTAGKIRVDLTFDNSRFIFEFTSLDQSIREIDYFEMGAGDYFQTWDKIRFQESIARLEIRNSPEIMTEMKKEFRVKLKAGKISETYIFRGND
ncbi:MAG: hypothetical protein GX452_13350 [Ignavibacteriales bacterium]|jgi:hypothetical protein|nr:hypothetical protein [Ignavibacteriaceae bacterium]NLH62380.1 hypothetical protein [Ignavibacteriales bacterium]